MKHPSLTFGRVLLIYLLIVVVLALLLFLFSPVLLPVILALLLSMLLAPLVHRLNRAGLSDAQAIIILLLFLATLFSALMYFAIPLVLDELSNLKSRLPEMWLGMSSMLEQASERLTSTLGFVIDLPQMLGALVSKMESWGTSLVVNTAGLLSQSLLSLILAPLISFFLLRDYRSIRTRLFGLLPNDRFELICLLYFRVNQQLQRYVKGILLQSAIIALVATVGFYLAGLEMAIVFGLLTGVLNIIPYVGPLFAMVPPLLLVLVNPDFEPFMLLSVIGVVLAAQLIDNLIVIPALIANTVNLHPLTVLLGVIIVGSFFGMWGVLLAIPFMAASKIIINGLYLGLAGSEKAVVD